MAGKRRGPSGPGPDGLPQGPTAVSTARVDRALRTLEDLVLAGRADEIPQWTAVLWGNRAEAQRLLLERLQTGSVRVPGLLLDVLAGLGGSRAATLLRRVAADPAVPDLIRIEARRRAGWPRRSGPRARAAFLRSLRDPAEALCGLAGNAFGTPVPDGAVLEEVLAHLLAVPPRERGRLVGRLIAEHGGATAWLLRALLAAADATTRMAAIEALVAMRDRGATAALRRLAATAPDAAGRAATVALRRLSLHAVGGTDGGQAPAARRRRSRSVEARVRPVEPPAFERAVATAVDAVGGQAITVFRAWDADLRAVVQVLLRDDGVTSIHGLTRVPRQQAGDVLRFFQDQHWPLVPLSLDEARQAVEWAMDHGTANGDAPPAALALWEPYLHADLRPRPPAVGPAPALALAGRAGVPDDDQVRTLLASPYCLSWQFLGDELAAALSNLPDDGASGRARYAALLSTLCPPPLQARIAGQLRRQAWLLDRQGMDGLRDVALGCACTLEAGDTPLVDQPLLRHMLARALAALRGT